MKRLTLLRHAKSSWTNPTLDDFERPLNTRGRRNALEMGERLRHLGLLPDRVLLSPARRSLETAELLLPHLPLQQDQIELDDEIYGASGATLLNRITHLSDCIEHLLLLGHNPGLTELWNRLAPQKVANIPTCSVFSLNLAVNQWGLIKQGPAQVAFIETPKNRPLSFF
ncbi:MAG: hypothetical protein C0621_03795 [Desulfuromonas sp.]|nr:MAG: hypothetical protein C0621_03795 [Desulfuromonas sp.]